MPPFPSNSEKEYNTRVVGNLEIFGPLIGPFLDQEQPFYARLPLVLHCSSNLCFLDFIQPELAFLPRFESYTIEPFNTHCSIIHWLFTGQG